MNVLTLKIIALVTMIIDHYGAIFQTNIIAFRMIGRLAFPIYCFLLVEGYQHTSDIRKYLKRLLVFALISEIPFDLALYGGLDLRHQNIFFTLSIGLIAMYLKDNKDGKYIFKNTTIFVGSIIVAIFLRVDYSFLGILYILLFHKYKDYPRKQKILHVACFMFLFNLISTGWIQQFALVSLPIIYFYNGELGPKNKISQIFFYAAYPLHLIVFYMINTM